MAYSSGISGAFNPTGNTVTFLANTTPPTSVQSFTVSNTSYCQYRIFNSGSNLVFLGWGNTATIANNNAVVVTTTAASVIPVLPGSLEIISAPSNTFFNGITSSGNSQVYITPGLGI